MSDVKRYTRAQIEWARPDTEFVLASHCATVEAERDTLRAQVATLQSDANSWQSGYDKGRHDGSKHRQDEVKQMAAQVEAIRKVALGMRGWLECEDVNHHACDFHGPHEACKALYRIDAALQATK